MALTQNLTAFSSAFALGRGGRSRAYLAQVAADGAMVVVTTAGDSVSLETKGTTGVSESNFEYLQAIACIIVS